MTEATETRRFPTIPGYAPQTEKLIELLKNGKVGDTLTANELQTASGRDCRSGKNGYGNLATARKYVQERHNLIWEWRDGILRCIDANEIHEKVESRRRHIHKHSKRAVKEAAIAVSRNGELAPERKTRLLASMAQLGTIAEFAHGSMTRKLESKSADKPLDLKKLVDQMS